MLIRYTAGRHLVLPNGFIRWLRACNLRAHNIVRAVAGLWPVRDNDNLKSHKYVCITTYQPDTKSNPNPNPNPNPTTKQHAIVNTELNIVTCPTYPDKFIRDNVVAPSVPT